MQFFLARKKGKLLEKIPKLIEDKMSSQNGMHTYNEIKSQGEIWRQVFNSGKLQLDQINTWHDQKHDGVMFIGCGSTYYLSLTAAKIWTKLQKESALGVPSSEVWFYTDTTFSKHSPLLVAVSRSGETTETIQAIDVYKKRFAIEPMVVSCYPKSEMAQSASIKILASAAQEKSVAQTRSFSSMLLLCQMIAGKIAKDSTFFNALEQVPAVFPGLLARYEHIIEEIAKDKKYQHFVFLGSGINYGLASEVMLKMKEMSTSISEVFHFMEFRHGPMSMITKNSLVIGLLSESHKEDEMLVLKGMKELGATTLALVNNAKGVDADFVVEFGASLPEDACGLLYLPLLQLLAYYHSISKGLDPDNPTNLSAVVHL